MHRLYPFGMMVVLALVTACSGKVSGVVFLDNNENGIKDPDEGRFVNVTVKAYDHSTNELIGTTKTTANGFNIPISSPGVYCIQLDQTSLDPTAGLAVAPAKAAFGTKVLGEEAAPFGTPTDTSSGSTGATPTSNASGTTTPETSTTTTSGTTSPSSTGGSVASTGSASSAQMKDAVCAETTTLSLELDLPVVRDYTIPMPSASKQTYTVGDTLTIALPFPQECKLKPLYLPDLLALAHTTKPQPIQFDPSINEVTFLPTASPAEGAAPGTAPGGTAPASTAPAAPKAAITIDAGGIDSHELKLRVRDDAPAGEHDLLLTPKAECPGGKEIDLPAIPFLVKVTPTLEVTLSVAGKPVLGGKLPLIAEVKNTAKAKYPKTTLVITAGGALYLTEVDATCDNLGNKAECAITMGPGGVAKRGATAQLPTKLSKSPTAFTFEASVTVEGHEEPVKAEPVQFSLEDPTVNDDDDDEKAKK